MVEIELRSLIHTYLIHKTDFVKKKRIKINEDQLRVFVDKSINDLCEEEHIEIPMEARIALIRELAPSGDQPGAPASCDGG